MAQQDQLNISKFTKILVSDIKTKDSKLHQILNDIVNAKIPPIQATGMVWTDDQAPAHYWRVGISNGTIVLTDLGTTKP